MGNRVSWTKMKLFMTLKTQEGRRRLHCITVHWFDERPTTGIHPPSAAKMKWRVKPFYWIGFIKNLNTYTNPCPLVWWKTYKIGICLPYCSENEVEGKRFIKKLNTYTKERKWPNTIMPGRREEFIQKLPMRGGGGNKVKRLLNDSLLAPPCKEPIENIPEIRLPGGEDVKPVFLGSCTEQHRIRSSSLKRRVLWCFHFLEIKVKHVNGNLYCCVSKDC